VASRSLFRRARARGLDVVARIHPNDEVLGIRRLRPAYQLPKDDHFAAELYPHKLGDLTRFHVSRSIKMAHADRMARGYGLH